MAKGSKSATTHSLHVGELMSGCLATYINRTFGDSAAAMHTLFVTQAPASTPTGMLALPGAWL
jgi:hypothetical protein